MAYRQAASRFGNRDLPYMQLLITFQKLQNSRNREKFKKLLKTAIIQKTPEESLAFLLNNSLTKYVYTNMRLKAKRSGANIWSSYNKVREVKLQCRSLKEEIFFSEKKAEVSLQSLLNHTVNRIVQLQKEVIIHNMMITGVEETEAVLICVRGSLMAVHSAYK